MGVLLLVPYTCKWWLVEDASILGGLFKMCPAVKTDENPIKLRQECIDLINYIIYRHGSVGFAYHFCCDPVKLLNSLLLLYNLKPDDNQSVLNAFGSTMKSRLVLGPLSLNANITNTICNIANVLGWHRIGIYIYDAFKIFLEKRTIEVTLIFLVYFISSMLSFYFAFIHLRT